MIGEAWQSFVSETAAWGAHAVFLRLLLATLVGVAIGIDRETVSSTTRARALRRTFLCALAPPWP